MAEETTQQAKTGRTFDSAYGFSFSIAVGLVLFHRGPGAQSDLEQWHEHRAHLWYPAPTCRFDHSGLHDARPVQDNEINAPCPNCGAAIRTSDAHFA
jgi:hypothetical protein